MTSIGSTGPLPVKDAAAPTANVAPGLLRSQPTPGPSLAGSGVGSDTSRLKNRDNLDKAGTQFEAVFTRMMLSSMRKTKLAETMFESKALDTFRDMQDSQVADAMAAHAPMGIGKAVTEFLAKSQKDLASQPDLNGPAATTPDS